MSKTKVFMAASCRRRTEMKKIMEAVESTGVLEVCSSWLWKPESTKALPWDKEQNSESIMHHSNSAHRDLSDLNKASIFVLQSEESGKYTSGGRLVEFGYFLGLLESETIGARRIIVVGRRENIYHAISYVEVVPDWEKAIERMVQIHGERVSA